MKRKVYLYDRLPEGVSTIARRWFDNYWRPDFTLFATEDRLFFADESFVRGDIEDADDLDQAVGDFQEFKGMTEFEQFLIQTLSEHLSDVRLDLELYDPDSWLGF